RDRTGPFASTPHALVNAPPDVGAASTSASTHPLQRSDGAGRPQRRDVGDGARGVRPTLSRWRPVASTRTPVHLSSAHTTLTFSGVSLLRWSGPPSRLSLSDKLVNELVVSPDKQSRSQ